VPQFILDSLIASNQGAKASIIVTQPRRVAATSVAARVSTERLDDGSVGYAIRGESKQSKFTKLLFCTTGVVLRRLSMGDALSNITHVIVDEVGSFQLQLRMSSPAASGSRTLC
jgi:ATP-dependent RNA helicase DHX57